MAAEKILPCPFCGKEASAEGHVHYSERMVKEQGWEQADFFYCNCMLCGASNQGLRGFTSRERAIAAWNHRAEPAAPEADRGDASVEQIHRELAGEVPPPEAQEPEHETFTPTARPRFCQRGGCKDSWHVGGNYGDDVCRNPSHHKSVPPVSAAGEGERCARR